MSEHRATIRWQCTGPDFSKGKYSREHTWIFDGGLVVAASASPSVVSIPYSNPTNIDPEEAFVAAISSCHMLTFLYLAYRAGYDVDAYEDEAFGVMTKNEKGVLWMSEVTLQPRITYSGDTLPTPIEEQHLHHDAHDQCYISNSIKTIVNINP
jgi:organic hydroperoxide reductase OsmC/OhrA